MSNNKPKTLSDDLDPNAGRPAAPDAGAHAQRTGRPILAKAGPPKNPAAVALGKLGGLARAKALTPKRRKEIAKKGGENSWKNRNKAVKHSNPIIYDG
jgi:hypothetical protein